MNKKAAIIKAKLQKPAYEGDRELSRECHCCGKTLWLSDPGDLCTPCHSNLG